MFATHSGFASAWLLALLGVWAALLLGSFMAHWAPSSKRQRTITRLRLASSATLVLAAWSWYGVARAMPGVAGFALLLAVGMTLGFLGDLSLAEALPVNQGFLVGMAAFALGHIAYITAILSLTPHIQWAVEGVAVLVGLFGWYLAVFRGADATALHWAALPYALLLATTAGVAVGLALQTPTFLPLAIGAALFLISDLLVAGDRFGSLRFPHIGEAVWLTYGPAQMLIVYAVNSALMATAAH
jgi:YhhN-like protein